MAITMLRACCYFNVTIDHLYFIIIYLLLLSSVFLVFVDSSIAQLVRHILL
jgi:hypothetical protein